MAGTITASGRASGGPSDATEGGNTPGGPSGKPGADPAAAGKYSRRRVVSLLIVHLLIAAHYVHWKLAGRTLAPLELNEAVYAAAEGVVTAGFLLLLLITASTLAVGRFFCSWGCHVLAVQDLSAWALGKFGIHPRPVRSRVLQALPFVVAGYMFVWPVVFRWIQGIEVAAHTREAGMAWSSFLTDDYTRNLPPWPIAVLTFATCCLFIIYLLGSRSFCGTVCPYGAIFALADKAAPGRIVAKGDCGSCNHCTSVCTSHIPVHLELARHKSVVSSSCMRDLDCVAACPDGRVGFGFTTPPLFRRLDRSGALSAKWDLSWKEESLVLVVLAGSFFALRGLFGALPFLLTLTFAVLLAFATWVSARLFRSRPVRMQGWSLRDARGVTGLGRAWLGANGLALAFVFHSGAMRGFELRAASELANAEAARGTPVVAAEHARTALGDLRRVRGLSFDPPRDLARRLARSAELAGDREAALAYLGELTDDDGARMEEARLCAESGRLEEAITRLDALLARRKDFADAHFQRGAILASLGRAAEGRASLEACLALRPDHAAAHSGLGSLLVLEGRTIEALEHLRRAVELAPEEAGLRFELGRALAAQGRSREAREELEIARRLDPRLADAVEALSAYLQ